jgi:hypothetical protein
VLLEELEHKLVRTAPGAPVSRQQPGLLVAEQRGWVTDNGVRQIMDEGGAEMAAHAGGLEGLVRFVRQLEFGDPLPANDSGDPPRHHS